MKPRRPPSPVLRRPTHRMTRQRRAILAALQATRSHPTAEELHQTVRAREPGLGLATVYRNLHVLAELGQVRELPRTRGESRFDANLGPHAHLTCTSCGQILDIVDPLDDRLDGRVARRHGMRIEGHHLEFFGICASCARRRASTRPSGRAARVGGRR